MSNIVDVKRNSIGLLDSKQDNDSALVKFDAKKQHVSVFRGILNKIQGNKNTNQQNNNDEYFKKITEIHCEKKFSASEELKLYHVAYISINATPLAIASIPCEQIFNHINDSKNIISSIEFKLHVVKFFNEIPLTPKEFYNSGASGKQIYNYHKIKINKEIHLKTIDSSLIYIPKTTIEIELLAPIINQLTNAGNKAFCIAADINLLSREGIKTIDTNNDIQKILKKIDVNNTCNFSVYVNFTMTGFIHLNFFNVNRKFFDSINTTELNMFVYNENSWAYR